MLLLLADGNRNLYLQSDTYILCHTKISPWLRQAWAKQTHGSQRGRTELLI